LKVGARKTQALHLMLVLCQRALSLNKSNEQGWEKASVFICFAHKNGELEIFAQYVIELTALDSSVS